jgi:asparagine synthase (glutamine-hydrolysing)
MSTIHCCFQPNTPHSADILLKMLDASDYWQPDATSQASNKENTCHLAKATLFNTALSRQDHVYTDQTGAIISANARIDNRMQLLQQLDLKSSITDGELILQTYQRWGNMCPAYLLGDFAFIIWDEVNQKVFCARDHFGVKLLLYSRTDKGFMLSNEPNAFFTSGWLKTQLKEPWLVKQLWRLGPTPVSTAYNGLEVVPAGHFMEIDGKNSVIEPYWKLTNNKQWKGLNDKDLLSELKLRFQHAVATRLESDYPLACELSEGLDSNGIAGYAATIKPQDTIYTLSYDCTALTAETQSVWGKTYEDIFEMLDLHANLQPIWTEEPVTEEDKSKLISNTGGSFALHGVWLWHCRLAHQKEARVLLAGWGGDHCVSTDGDYYESELFNSLKWLQLHHLFRDKHRRGRGSTPIKAWIHLLMKHITPGLSRWYTRKRSGLEHALWQRVQYSLLKENYINKYRLTSSLKKFTDGYHRYSTKGYHRRELFEIGLEQRLIDSELSARMHRVEFRFPMLDVPLVEFAYNLPSHLKIYKGIERYAFRHILEGKTTERIQWRLKRDVNHPNRDPFFFSEKEMQEIQELLQSPLLQKYCHTKTLDIKDPEAKIVLFMFRGLSPLFRYFADNNIPVEGKIF